MPMLLPNSKQKKQKSQVNNSCSCILLYRNPAFIRRDFYVYTGMLRTGRPYWHIYHIYPVSTFIPPYFCGMLSISHRGQTMPPSPIRKLVPYAEAAKKKGIKVYHLNIGQPDIETPPAILDAVRHADFKVLEY